MYQLKSVVILCLLALVSSSTGGTSQYHRSTTLDELKDIDGLVSSGLPLFNHGFFVNTAHGPVLVKERDESKKNMPGLNPGYYSTLPRVVPSGFEGIAISHFNLGTAIPAQAPTLPIGSVFEHEQFQQPPQRTSQLQHFQHSFQYSQNNNNAPEVFQPRHHQQSQSRQFIHRHFRAQQEPLQSHPQQRSQRFFTQRHKAPVEQEPFQTFQIDNYLRPNDNDNDGPTSYQNLEMSHDEPLSPHTDTQEPSTPSQRFSRNPTVVKAFAFDETLPDNLRNPFYRNEQLASALAQESLPVEGEVVVESWDTTKIQKQKIQELLRGAGFI